METVRRISPGNLWLAYSCQPEISLTYRRITDLNLLMDARQLSLYSEAQTYLAEHEPDACSEKALQALSILQVTRSQSGLSRLSSLHQQLESVYAHHEMVQRLGEQLRAGREH